ncbi:MAG TPA: class F sortase [Clostridia bacterium]|nr:class F sortase [Clostridia bacterium]
MSKKINILLYIISGLLLASGIFLVIRQYVLIPGSYVSPGKDVLPTVTASAAPSPTPSPTPGTTPTGGTTQTPAVTPSPTPYIKPIPLRIYFIDAEVMCDIVPVGRIEEGERAGQMDTVDNPDLAAWYQDGPAPGENGNALLNGHKSWKGKIGRFSVLWNMRIDDLVAVALDNGEVRYFTVISVDFYPYNDVPAEVMNLESTAPRMTLITCYGEFDQAVQTSSQRCVVVCEPIADDDPRLANIQ